MIRIFEKHTVLKDAKKETLFSELHSLLTAGLDFSHSFELLTDSEPDSSVKSLLETLYASVVGGHTLWESLAVSGKFTPLDYGVIRIGEETGQIAEALQFLSGYYRKRMEQRRMVIGAVSYPLIILATAMVVLVFMVTVIVPMFSQVYARMGGELPWLTRQMIGISECFPLFLGGGLFIAAAIILFFRFYGHTPRVRACCANLILRLPLIGDPVVKNQQARFCRLLWLLYHSGIPLLTAIGMLHDIITFYPYQQSFLSICEGLRRGELFATTLTRFPRIYDRKLCALLRVGEETNHLAEMLSRQGDELTRELEFRLKQLGSFLEPVLILGIGTLVALVLIAMYLPMFKLGGVMG